MGNKWRLTESEAAICFKPLFRKICHNKNSGKKFYRLIIFTPHSYMSLEDNNLFNKTYNFRSISINLNSNTNLSPPVLFKNSPGLVTYRSIL